MNGLLNKLGSALLGTPATVNQFVPQQQFPNGLEEYLKDLDGQQYIQNLLKQPKETGLTLDQYKEGIAQGLNFGVPEIAQKQQELGIIIPKTPEEIEKAKMGEFNQYPISTGLVTGPRKGGILPDIARGYQENYNNGFNINNFGQNKGWAERIGEGLGTVGRFIDSPLGRGLIAAGLNKAMGYDNSLQEGLTAAVGRQNAQTADRVYRQQLSQMGYSDQDLANIRGNITPEIYKGLTDSFRLGNQRMTYGQLAMFDDSVAEQVRQNPELANQFIPMTFARDIYGKKRDLAENKINVDAKKLEQNERRLNILQQRVNQGAATAAELSEYRALKAEQMQLENELYRKELGKSGGGSTVRPVGQTKSGVKYKVVG